MLPVIKDFGPFSQRSLTTLTRNGFTMFWPRPEKVVQRKKVPLPKWSRGEMSFCHFKNGQKQGSPQKMTPSSETEFFLGWFQWESCSPGYSGHLLHWQKSRSLYKKLTFGPKYPNFWVKMAHFRPQRPIWASPVNVFNRKKVPQWFLMWGYQKFSPLPPKNGPLAPKRAKFDQKLTFLAKYRPFWSIWSHAWLKNYADKLPRWF